VGLAPISDPALVARTVARELGLLEEARQRIEDTLLVFLRGRQLLLVLDNCEHLIEACVRLADLLLHACPKLKLLASSREALGVEGETAYRVPSLPTPDPQQAGSLEAVQDSEAVKLFVERARSVLPSFHVTPQNAATSAQICQRLDGIPLAIELAAARLNMLTTEQLAHRLDQAFRLLTGGSRTALPRQQTLRATIDWSYQLLAEPERVLLRRLSVFAGGCLLEAVEEVCSGDGLVHHIAQFIQLQADHLAGRVAAHGDTVDHIRRLHGIAVVSDDGELRGLRQLGQQLAEAAYVGLVEHGIHFVQHTEGSGGDFKQREDERHSR